MMKEFILQAKDYETTKRPEIEQKQVPAAVDTIKDDVVPAPDTETEQKNAVTQHVYVGNNQKILAAAGFTSPLWVGKYQAVKLKKQVKADAVGVVIKAYYTDDDGRQFCKLEKVYNIEQLENLQKIENTVNYKEMIEELKAV